MSSRKIKHKVLELLGRRDLASILKELQGFPAKGAVNVLFSAICREDPAVRWQAISCMGAAVGRLADEDMEEARIVMRRLLWSLNDESGGIGWGAPESLAESMCCHAGLAAEYVHMLISYMREEGTEKWQEGNFIEHPLLQRGLLWGIARLGQCHPELLREKDIAYDLPPYLMAPDAEIRGLAALAAGVLRLAAMQPILQQMTTDSAALTVYLEGGFLQTTVGQLAQSALEALNK